MKPDMHKVHEAVEAIELRQHLHKPEKPVPSPAAQDEAIRKPLVSHGIPCCGFNYLHFLNRD